MNKTTTLLLSTVAIATMLAPVNVYAQGDEVRFGPETYSAADFDVDNFVGTIEIIVEDRNTIEISAVGDAEHMEPFAVDTSGDTVEISYDEDDFHWNDWSTWVSWWGSHNIDIEDYPVVTVRLPEGTPVDIDRLTGDLTVGDLNGPFDLRGVGALDATIGDVTIANIRVAGAADVELGNVAGNLIISISGAGDVTAGTSRRADVSIHGASDIRLGAIAGGLDVSVAGVGDVRVESVNGPVDISLAGSGDVTINEGRASSFDVSIAGSGDVDFGGTAVDPDISIAGSGHVRIEEYEGRLDHSGMGSVSVGS
jgi:hypothetical protein